MRPIALIFLASVLAAPAAYAQDDPGDAAAEALFRDGRTLMTEHRYPEACTKLAESQRIDPHLGTLLNLAACRALEGRTATAWAAYEEARAQAARAGRADREAFAVEQLRAIEPRLARVRVVDGHPPAGLILSLDGQQLEVGALGTAIPIDPGAHQLIARAPGHAPWSTSFDAREAAVTSVSVPDLAPLETRAAEPRPAPGPPAPPETPVQERSSRTSPFVWVLGGAALVGAGVGSYFGLRAFARNGDANAACPNEACSSAGLQADSAARKDAAISTVGFALAGAAAVGGVVLFAIGRGSTAPRVALAPAGVVWMGAW